MKKMKIYSQWNDDNDDDADGKLWKDVGIKKLYF